MFGPRGTGKTSLLRELFAKEKTLWIDLLNTQDEELYQLTPQALESNIEALATKPEWVVIDEVQKAPKLLNHVHSLIEKPWNQKRVTKFALTSSSARKLKKGASNLMAGRAFTNNLHPLTFLEIGGEFNLQQTLSWGSLPFVLNVSSAAERKAYLQSYSATYLKEEIAQEQIVRNLLPFRKFLAIAAQYNGSIVNYNNIATELHVDWSTVRNYFEILEDTLIGFRLPAFSKSIRKQQLSSPKFYLFDLGVQRALNKSLSIEPSAGQIMGPLFEHFIICECIRINDYLNTDFTFSYLTTQGGAEIDLIVERPGQNTAFVEIKSTNRVTDKHLKHLRNLSDGLPNIDAYCFCQENRARKLDNILITPWDAGIRAIFGLLDSTRF